MTIKNEKMKKILLILFIFTTTTIVAQRQMNRQNVRLLKTSYLTDAINLTPAEAEKFWPVYNKYTYKIQDLKISLKNILRFDERLEKNNISNLSEKEAKKLLDSTIQIENEITENKKQMFLELSKIISAKKIVQLQKSENDFNKQLLMEYGRRHRYQGGKQ